MDEELLQLAVRVGELLRWRGEKLVVAESCTGGLVAKSVTDVAGSSEWFDRGYVVYSNAAKSECLGVDPALIATHGAVSAEVAAAAARGALRHSAAHWAIAITGIAGPGGGSADKPVGLVHFGWCSAQSSLGHNQVFQGDRRAVRAQAAALAMQGLVQILDAAQS